MKKVENGNYVKLCYTGKLEDGVVFDKTERCKPLEIQVGSGNLVEGFEKAIVGMSENERKAFTLEPEDAYGERDERLERSFKRANLPINFEPARGQVIVFMVENGRELPAVVKYVDEEMLVVDFNHPLAGRAIEFEVEVAEINEQPSPSLADCGTGCCCA